MALLGHVFLTQFEIISIAAREANTRSALFKLQLSKITIFSVAMYMIGN